MVILVEEIVRDKYAIYVTATCEKKSAFISVEKDGSLNVCCRNASHNVWKGSGRFFNNEDEALNGYKSSEMKALIRMAVSETNQTETQTIH